jgi:putative peptidoglycan lipid II flippase
VLLMVLRYEVILMLFQRGKFDPGATGQTSLVLIFFMVGSFAFAANTIVPRAYYAMQDTVFPAIYGTIAVVLSIPMYVVGMNLFGARGVALAVSLSGILQVLVLYVLWNKRTKNTGSRDVYRTYLKIIFVSAPLGIFLTVFKSKVLSAIDSTTFSGSLGASLITGFVFICALLLAGYFFKIKEVREVLKRLLGGRLLHK